MVDWLIGLGRLVGRLVGWLVSIYPVFHALDSAFQPQTVLFLRMHACITWSYTYMKEGRKEGHSLTHSHSLSLTLNRQTNNTSAFPLLPSLLCLFSFLFFSFSLRVHPLTHLSLSFLYLVSVLIHFVLVRESFVRSFVHKALPG